MNVFAVASPSPPAAAAADTPFSQIPDFLRGPLEDLVKQVRISYTPFRSTNTVDWFHTSPWHLLLLVPGAYTRPLFGST